MATYLVFLPGEPHEQRSLVAYTVHGVAMSWTRLSDRTTKNVGVSGVMCFSMGCIFKSGGALA